MKPSSSHELAAWFPQTEDIRLYCGVCENDWNGQPVQAGKFVCVSPVYGKTKRINTVKLSPATTVVIQDSGAFCDGPGQRLSFAAALKRQVDHAARFDYDWRISHRASYDFLLVRSPHRCSEALTWEACIETIRAAAFLSAHREGLPCILSAQGVTAAHYLKCVQGVLPYMQPGDMLGLGGWCPMGRRPSLLPRFREMAHQVIPFVADEGVKHIHLWGCLFAPALGELLYLCDQFGMTLSVDSVYPSLRPVFGQWGYSYWVDRSYRRPPLAELGRHREMHVQCVREWLNGFRDLEQRYYRWVPVRQQWHDVEDLHVEASALTSNEAVCREEESCASMHRCAV